MTLAPPSVTGCCGGCTLCVRYELWKLIEICYRFGFSNLLRWDVSFLLLNMFVLCIAVPAWQRKANVETP